MKGDGLALETGKEAWGTDPPLEVLGVRTVEGDDTRAGPVEQGALNGPYLCFSGGVLAAG